MWPRRRNARRRRQRSRQPGSPSAGRNRYQRRHRPEPQRRPGRRVRVHRSRPPGLVCPPAISTAAADGDVVPAAGECRPGHAEEQRLKVSAVAMIVRVARQPHSAPRNPRPTRPSRGPSVKRLMLRFGRGACGESLCDSQRLRKVGEEQMQYAARGRAMTPRWPCAHRARRPRCRFGYDGSPSCCDEPARWRKLPSFGHTTVVDSAVGIGRNVRHDHRVPGGLEPSPTLRDVRLGARRVPHLRRRDTAGRCV